MGDEDERARELDQGVLEHLESGNVEVVGRLVEDEQVRRLQHETRDQDARLLATREAAHRRLELLGPEEEALGPARHVHLAPLVDDGVTFGRERALEAERGIEGVALLLEHDHLQFVRALDLARVRGQGAREHLQQRRLPAAVGTQEAEARPRGEDEVELAHDRLAAQLLPQSARGQEPTRAPSGRGQLDARRRPGLGIARARLRQLVDLAVRFLHARLGLGRAGAGLAAQPLDLPVHDVGQRLLVGGLAAEDLVTLFEEGAVVALRFEEATGVGAAQLEHARGDVLEEVAVVAHHRVRAGMRLQHALQPEDAFHVEMVRGLVHEEDVRRAHELPHDGQALLPTAGQRSHVLFDVLEPRATQGHGDEARRFVRIVGARRRHDALDGLRLGKHGVLRDVADPDLAAQRSGPRVRRLQTGQDLEEGRLARAVRPDEPDAISFEEAQRQVLEQRTAPERLTDPFAAQQERPAHLRLRRGRTGAASSSSFWARVSALMRSSSLSARLQVISRRFQTRTRGRRDRVYFEALPRWCRSRRCSRSLAMPV